MLPDVLEPELRLVICGTAASAKSAQVGAYYAGPGNKFWSMLAEVGLTPRQLQPAEFPRLRKFGIGLTDIAKGQSGSDADITFTHEGVALVREKIEAYAPNVLCFNGKRAASEFFGVKTVEYGLQEERIGETLLFVAPSTSGAASGAWDVRFWRQLAELVGCREDGAE